MHFIPNQLPRSLQAVKGERLKALIMAALEDIDPDAPYILYAANTADTVLPDRECIFHWKGQLRLDALPDPEAT